MTCNRFQSDGMKFLDGEMGAQEKERYEAHVRECGDCKRELEELGMVVAWTEELRLKTPEDAFWDTYWDGIYRRMERGAGFFLIVGGVTALILYGIVKAVTSPSFFTFPGIAVTVVLLGVLALFLSVARERYHERRNDPYRKVQR